MIDDQKTELSSNDSRTLVLLCPSLEHLGQGLDLERIQERLETGDPKVQVFVLPHLCEKPASLPKKVSEHATARLVLGLCSHNDSRAELNASARKAQLDPFGVEIVSLGTYCAYPHTRSEATEKAQLLLKAAVARAQLFAGTQPQSVKTLLSWNQKVTRRSLFTLPPLIYEPVPAIRSESCVAQDGCRVCATECPRNALSVSDRGVIALDKTSCTGCGACLSACPHTAIEIPGYSPEQIDAHLTSVLDTKRSSINPRAVLFICSKGVPIMEGLLLNYPPNWMPVELPCLGMVTLAWILQSLNLGSTVVGLLPCGRKDCRFGKPEVIRGRVNYGREFLELLGTSPERIRLLDSADKDELDSFLNLPLEEMAGNGEHSSKGGGLFGPQNISRAILNLARKLCASSEGSIENPHAPLGYVTLGDGCTACEVCAATCPTNALILERDADELALSFDPQLCIGCGQCVPVCPEGIVTVRKGIDLGRLSRVRGVLHRAVEVRCKQCGGPVAPSSMLQKVASLLGSDPAAALVQQYCPNCRGNLLFSGSDRSGSG